MSHRTFSDNLPTECIGELYAFATTQSGNKRDVLRAAFVVADYASQFAIGEPAPEIDMPGEGLADEDVPSALATQLKPLVGLRKGASTAGLSINWKALLALILQLLPIIIGG